MSHFTGERFVGVQIPPNESECHTNHRNVIFYLSVVDDRSHRCLPGLRKPRGTRSEPLRTETLYRTERGRRTPNKPVPDKTRGSFLGTPGFDSPWFPRCSGRLKTPTDPPQIPSSKDVKRVSSGSKVFPPESRPPSTLETPIRDSFLPMSYIWNRSSVCTQFITRVLDQS